MARIQRITEHKKSWRRRYRLVIPALTRLRQEGCLEFQTNLNYRGRPCFKEEEEEEEEVVVVNSRYLHQRCARLFKLFYTMQPAYGEVGCLSRQMTELSLVSSNMTPGLCL